jgi:MerR family transcriptional regulator, copper efflux regulator
MLTIGHVAREAGVQPSAIRYYEAQGILRPPDRRPNGYRVYTNDAVKLLLFVRRAQMLGITLKEIKPLLHLATRGQPPCKHVKELARSHLREINDKIRELQTLRNELHKLTRRKAGRPQGNKVCPLIENFALKRLHKSKTSTDIKVRLEKRPIGSYDMAT